MTHRLTNQVPGRHGRSVAPPRGRRTVIGAAAAALLLVALPACGGESDDAVRADAVQDDDAGAAPVTTDLAERELAGIVRTPAPKVDATALPSLTTPGDDAVFRAEPGGYLAVYFGFTNCPDVCPTTMADWVVALRRLPPELAEQVGTMMVTVDPDRDNELLAGYITSFVEDGEAAGTTDADLLAAAAEPFGVSYDVVTTDEGDIEVSHSGFLYLVDDQGQLVVTWPFGLSSQDMAGDVQQLFAENEAA